MGVALEGNANSKKPSVMALTFSEKNRMRQDARKKSETFRALGDKPKTRFETFDCFSVSPTVGDGWSERRRPLSPPTIEKRHIALNIR
jgi:hypothetical protein